MNSSRSLLSGLLWIGMITSLCAQAAVAVIYDSGHTQPIAPYTDTVRRAEQPDSTVPPHPTIDPLSTRLPVRTTRMSPGPLQGQPAAEIQQRLAHMTQPFFIIGSDRTSLQWLRQQRNRLRALGAVGLVVQARSITELQRVQRTGDGLTIIPVPGDSLSEALGLTRYPVLISQGGIEQ